MRLENKICLITGAAQGIGLAIAQEFARQGATVFLTDIQVKKVLKKPLRSVNQQIICDLTCGLKMSGALLLIK